MGESTPASGSGSSGIGDVIAANNEMIEEMKALTKESARTTKETNREKNKNETIRNSKPA